MRLGLRVLWVDDQPEYVRATIPVLGDLVGEVTVAGDADSALEELEANRPDLVLLDLQLPPGSWGGLDFLERLPKSYETLPVIVLSGRGAVTECVRAMRLGANDYVEKENVSGELKDVVLRVLDELAEKNRASDYTRISSIERAVHAQVVSVLSREAERLGYRDAFAAGLVPKKIALKTYERWIEHGSGDQYEFMDLVDLREIIDQLWTKVPEFRHLEGIIGPKNRTERTSWIVHLNEIRQVAAHPVRGSLTDSMRHQLLEIEGIVRAWVGKLSSEPEG